MTVFVESDPTSGKRKGDWIVVVGNRTVSRHRKKKTAVKKAKKKARKRGSDVKIQNSSTGHWKQGPSY
jgi:hypothetical protein